MPYLVGYATPQDYGAAGNGTSDDTTAVQAAITAVGAAGGGVCYFPAGTYKLTSALSVPNLVSLIGAGPGASVLSQTSTTANAITYNPTTLAYVSVQNLTLQGPGSGSGVGLLLEANSGTASVTSCSVQDLTISGFGSHGLEIVSGVGCSVSTVNVASVGGHGIYVSGGTGLSLSGCYVNGSTSTQQGFNLTGASHASLTGCRAYKTGGGFLISGGSTNAVVGCGADTITAQAGQDGTGFKITSGVSHSLTTCYSTGGNAVAFWATGSTVAALIEGVQETAPGGSATASIKVDTGSTATVIDYSVVTATSFAANTATVLSGNTLSVPTTGTSTLGAVSATNVTASGTLGVTGTSTLGTVNAGAVSASGTLGVTGTSTLAGVNATNVSASGTLGVTGTSTLAAVNATNVSASGTLGVTGASTLAGVSATNVTASGTLGVTGNTTLSGTLAAGATSITGTERVSTTLTVGSASSLGDNGVGELQLADAGTVPTTNPSAGVVVYSQSAAAIPLRVRDTAGSVRGLMRGTAASTADQTSVGTGQTASTFLTINVEASAVYLIEAWVYWTISGTPTVTTSWSTTATGSTMIWCDTTSSGDVVTTLTGVSPTWPSGSTSRLVRLFGVLTTSTTAGVLTFTFASSVSASVTVKSGSYLLSERIK